MILSFQGCYWLDGLSRNLTLSISEPQADAPVLPAHNKKNFFRRPNEPCVLPVHTAFSQAADLNLFSQDTSPRRSGRKNHPKNITAKASKSPLVSGARNAERYGFIDNMQPSSNNLLRMNTVHTSSHAPGKFVEKLDLRSSQSYRPALCTRTRTPLNNGII